MGVGDLGEEGDFCGEEAMVEEEVMKVAEKKL